MRNGVIIAGLAHLLSVLPLRSRRTGTHRTDDEQTLDRWMRQLQPELGVHIERRITDSCADLLETLSTRPDAVPAAMHRIGRTLGDDGWPLERIQAWVHHLTRLVDRRRRTTLRSFSATVALAEGWAAGMVRGGDDDLVTDAVTGLSTPLVLEVRLRELYSAAAEHGRSPRDTHVLVVVEVPSNALAPFHRDVAMVTVGSVVEDVFRSAEVLCRSARRIAVLTERSLNTEARATVVYDRLRMSSLVDVHRADVWTEHLPLCVDGLAATLRTVTPGRP